MSGGTAPVLLPGDILFVDGGHVLDNAIVLFESVWSALRGRDSAAHWSHTGVLDTPATVFETTNWRTATRGLHTHYAGSQIGVWRWAGMTPEALRAGLAAVEGQRGRVYPYWRLILHAVGLAGLVHGRTMECSVLAATFLRAAGLPLRENPWTYDPDKLADELIGCPSGAFVFRGSLREAGLP